MAPSRLLCPHPPEATERRAESSFPRFVLPIEQCGVETSSPVPVTVAELWRFAAAWPRRLVLMDRFMTIVGILGEQANVHGALIGGSFLNANVDEPRDLDCLIYYSAKAQAGLALPGCLLNARTTGHRLGIDLRVAPTDSDPMLLVRMTSFMSNLFLARRAGDDSSRGLVLLDLCPEN
jgi:hypothetical protein